MQDLDDLFGTDEKKEEEGTWLPLGGDAQVLVCRVRNKSWRQGLKKLPKGIQMEIANGTISDEKYQKVMITLIGRYILKGWKNLTVNGLEVEYSSQTAIDLLTKYPDFKDKIFEMAGEIDNFKKKEDLDLGEDLEEL